jgi:putative transposase
MKKSRFSESQIFRIFKEADGGREVVDICREHGVRQVIYYQWKSKFGGTEASDICRIKELEEENSKAHVRNLSLENEALKDVIAKKL